MNLLFLAAVLTIAHAPSDAQIHAATAEVPEKLNKEEKNLLVAKFDEMTRESKSAPESTYESLQMMIHQDGKERKQFEQRIQQMITSWTQKEGSDVANLTSNQIDEAVDMLVTRKLAVRPEVLQSVGDMINAWIQEKGSKLAKLNTVQRRSVVKLVGLLHQSVSNVIHFSTHLTEKMRKRIGSDFMQKIKQNQNLDTLTLRAKKTLRDEFVSTTDNIRQKPLSRIGVLSMLGNRRGQENDEFIDHLRETVVEWARKNAKTLSNLKYTQINELAEMLFGLSGEYAGERTRLVVKLVKALKLSPKQTRELSTKLVDFIDDIRRKAEKSPNYKLLKPWLHNNFDTWITKKGSKLRDLNGNQLQLLVEKIANAVQENKIMPTSTLESLYLLITTKTEEQARREDQIRILIKSWTEEKGSVLANLTTDNTDELVTMIFEISKTVLPETLEKTEKLVEQWAQESGSKIASLSKEEKMKIAHVTGLLHQTVWSVIHSNTPLTDDVRKSLGETFKMALGKIPYLGSDLENALTNEYVAKMNEIRMEQLTRVGVLSMLENPTPDELKEFRNQLKWIILGWTMTPGSPISTLNDEAMKEVAEVLVNLRKTYADLHRKPIKRLVDKLLLSGPQTSYVTNKLVKYGDDMRRTATGW